MRSGQIVEFGGISADGKLRLPMDRVREYLKEHAGQNVIVQFEAVEPGTSAALWGYYNSYVLPTVRQALYELGNRMTLKESDIWLREMCPMLDRSEDCGPKELNLLTQNEMLEFLDWIKQMAAENLYIYIEDPKII